MRFCMITTFYPPYNFGGDGIFVHHLSNELARRGHHVEVIHCRDAYRLCTRGDTRDTYQDHPNVTVHGLHSRWGALSPLATQQTGRPWFKAGRIRRILEQPFDVIHYHNISLVGGPDILTYGRGLKLYTMHEYWLVCPTHVLFRYQRAPCLRPHCLLCSLTYQRPPQWWRYTRLLSRCLKQVDAFLAPGRFSMDRHRDLGLQIPVRCLPNFVPEDGIESPPVADAPAETVKDPFFLFVGRLEQIKGVHTLIPLFRRYPRARLLIAGAGRDESKLRNMVEAGDRDRIQFLGYLSGRQLRDRVQRAVAVLVPSLCYENHPLVILEAFRQQTPVVVRQIGGLPEIIEESRGGLMYRTEEELRTALDRLITEPALRRELGRNAYSAYLKKWTPEAHLKQYFELIRELQSARDQGRKPAPDARTTAN